MYVHKITVSDETARTPMWVWFGYGDGLQNSGYIIHVDCTISPGQAEFPIAALGWPEGHEAAQIKLPDTWREISFCCFPLHISLRQYPNQEEKHTPLSQMDKNNSWFSVWKCHSVGLALCL